MASNKFATMLHRNTNKITVILVYAVLEWLLIILLLLNSFFSYLITKFAKWVGLQPPCPWCSRVDHVLETGKRNTNLQRDLVCEAHAAEISKLGFCTNHRKLAETESMCEDCLSSRPNHNENSIGITHRIAFLSWVSHNKHENGEDINRCSCCNESLSSRFYPPYLPLKPFWGDGNYTSKGTLIVEAIDDENDEGEKDHALERNNGEDHEDEGEESDEHQILSDIESFILREVGEDRSSSVSNLHSDEKDAEKYEKEDDLTIAELDPNGTTSILTRQFSDTSTAQAFLWEDRSLEVINLHFQKNAVCDILRLIPVELIDSSTTARLETCKLPEDLEENDKKIETSASEQPIEAQSSNLVGELLDDNAEKTTMEEHESLNTSMTGLEDFLVLEVEESNPDSVIEVNSENLTTQAEATQILSNDDNSVEAATEEPDDAQAILPRSQEQVSSYEYAEEDKSSSSDDDTEVPNAFDEFIAQNNLCKAHTPSDEEDNVETDIEEPEDTPEAKLHQEPACSCQCIEDQSSTSDDDTQVPNAFDEFIAQNNLCTDRTGDNDCEPADQIEETNLVEKNHGEPSHKSSKFSESYEGEEDKLPETPTSVDGLHYLLRKLTEESVDGSVASEAEYGDPVSTIERLKTALKSERKALGALYQELEEERSASAIAANQTMAMITRLQEEKAAMHMEALQYQRMMEEQSEYDQEALQLLNELMVKREKEKQELEKELEEYKQKVIDYEAKEKLRALRRMKGGSTRSRASSSSCTNMGETDELPVDLNPETREEDNGFFNHQESSHSNTADDEVSNLEEMALDCVKHMTSLETSLDEFEEERLSILDQLKVLEDKLITLYENEQFSDDTKLIDYSSNDGDKDLNESCNFSSPENNGYSSDGFLDKKNCPRKTMASMAKRLLPYLDAADTETEEAYTFETQEPKSVITKSSLVPKIEMDSKAASIEEEIDHVYERLQALEADKELLQDCMGSVQEGDKGMDLLREIMKHLRDLKDMELRLKSLSDNSV
ncbi:hypothetical protein L6164_030816 [Bauhinia variegata]|uniref:Uncharacterized protein n=1 Tax=Bauhinia variegata TaxID=167791 RepID=A0ACB9LDM9_BAUVA|nr:hypothetical protein L6164_030816 [Bauhinia variegata]